MLFHSPIILTFLTAGVQVLINTGIFPLIGVFVEPAKVLFLNNAINHGIFTPLGAEQVATAGKSIFYMIETNPGPGTGVLLAYWLWAKDPVTKGSAPGALVIHLLGGIHEISFPYILMKPQLLIATISGSVSALFYYNFMGLGLSGPPAPGSIIAYLAMAPKGSTLSVIFGVFIAAAVTFVISTPIIKFSNHPSDLEHLEAAKVRTQSMKAVARGQIHVGESIHGVNIRILQEIIFACDAGMGSSAMGAAILNKQLKQAGITDVKVTHASVSEIPPDTQYVVCHRDLAERAKKSAPAAKLVTITDFMAAPEYAQIVQEIIDARV